VKRPRKILLAIVGTVAAVILLGAVLLPFAVNADSLRPQAEAKLQAALGRRVSLGAVKLSLWGGLALRADSLRIGEPLAGPAAGALLVDAGPTSIHVAWLPLLRKDVQARSITIEGLRVTQDAKPLVSALAVSSRLRIAPDGTIETGGSVDGVLSAMTAAPRVRADFTAALSHGTLDLTALDATVGPMRIEAVGRVTDSFSPAPRLALEGTAKLKRSQVKGRFDVVVAASPRASFELSSPLLDADEIMAAVALLAGNAPAPRASSWLAPEANAAEAVPAAAGPSFVRMMEAEGSLRADRCVAHGLEMTNLSARVSLVRGLAELREVKFALYGGKAQGSLTVRPFEPRMPFSLEQTAEGIAIRPLIAALAPAQAGTLEGKASLAVRLSGEAGGPALLPSMNGAGNVAIANGKIASFGVIKQVMKALEVAGAKGVVKDETPFDHLSAHFDLAQGTAATKDLEFRSDDLNGDGAGTVGAGGALALDVLASFSRTISDELVAKTHALSIRQGEDGRLSVPLQIRGTIQQPRVQLDLDKVIREGALKELKKEGTKSLLKRLLGR
jgi:uncharacterized protein involved in outer membrane biogenesis